MSLDRSALELIQETTLAAENEANDRTEFEIATVSKGMEIVSLEKYQVERNRFRASFLTETLADYISYVEEHQGDHSFINLSSMLAKTVFDIGNNERPGHCKHKATLKLDNSPEYAAVLTINEQRISQRVLAEFIEDWQPNIGVLDADGKEMETRKAINAIRRITIESLSKGETQVANLSESRSTLETIEAKSGDAALPAWIYFDFVPYEGFTERVFAMRVSVSTAHGEPKLRATIQTLQKHKVEMANELSTLISEGLPSIKIYLGTIITD